MAKTAKRATKKKALPVGACLCYRVTGAKIDRHNAKAEEVGAGVLEKNKKTSWKLLVCPVCKISARKNVLNRDRSAASAIAANHEKRMLAKRFNCTAPVHDARGFDPNVLPENTG